MKNIVKTSVWLIGLLLVSMHSAAQQAYNMFEFRWSNDFFFQTDYNFTNGFDLAYYSENLNRSILNSILIAPKNATSEYHSLTLTQHFFTPKNLFSFEIDQKDRPFASYLMIGQKKTSFNKNLGLRMESEIRAGIFGKYSGGHSIQNGIHRLLPASEPAIGWGNQLNTDIALNYIFLADKAILTNSHSEIYLSGKSRVGIPYTDISGGIFVRYHHNKSHFQFYAEDFHWFVFSSAELRLVGYNAVLQGGLFSSNAFTIHDPNRVVSILHGGFGIGKNNLSLEAGLQYNSPETSTIASHKWGYVTFKFRF